MKSVGDALNRRELLWATAALGAGAWLPAGNFSPVHDPCVIKAGDTYRLFCTGGPVHVAVLRDHARDYLDYHAYDATPDGWPRVTA